MAGRVDLPIACSLEGHALDQRRDDWVALLKDAKDRRAIPGGVEIMLPVSTPTGELQALIDQEQECCAWMRMRITRSGDGLLLAISSLDPTGERQIHTWFGQPDVASDRD